MSMKKTAAILSAAAALSVFGSSSEADAGTCNVNAPTPIAGSACTNQGTRARGVARESQQGKRFTYKVKLEVGNTIASGVLLDASGARSRNKDGGNCTAVNDLAPVNASFGQELGCDLLIAFSPVTFKLEHL